MKILLGDFNAKVGREAIFKPTITNENLHDKWSRSISMFGPKRHEVTGDWRKVRKEELHNVYSSPSIIRIKSRRMRLVGHVA
jgi:hypothetical protein